RDADGTFRRSADDRPHSIGRVRAFLGNFGVLVRAYTYMRTLGEEGMVETSEDAILAANYLLARLRDRYQVAYDRTPMHEFVLTAARRKKKGASALDLATELIDEGF